VDNIYLLRLRFWAFQISVREISRKFFVNKVETAICPKFENKNVVFVCCHSWNDYHKWAPFLFQFGLLDKNSALNSRVRNENFLKQHRFLLLMIYFYSNDACTFHEIVSFDCAIYNETVSWVHEWQLYIYYMISSIGYYGYCQPFLSFYIKWISKTIFRLDMLQTI